MAAEPHVRRDIARTASATVPCRDHWRGTQKQMSQQKTKGQAVLVWLKWEKKDSHRTHAAASSACPFTAGDRYSADISVGHWDGSSIAVHVGSLCFSTPLRVPTTSSSEGEASQESELKEICKQLFNVGILIPSVSYFQAFLPRRKSYKRFL